MNDTDLANIASSYMKIWEPNHQNLLDIFAHKNLIVSYSHFEEPIEGVQSYKQFLAENYQSFPDLKIKLNRVIPSEEQSSVTVFWFYEATHKNGILFDVKSSGKKVSICGITHLEIDEGCVVKESGIVDNFQLYKQIQS